MERRNINKHKNELMKFWCVTHWCDFSNWSILESKSKYAIKWKCYKCQRSFPCNLSKFLEDGKQQAINETKEAYKIQSQFWLKNNRGQNTDLIFDDDIPNLYIILAENSKRSARAICVFKTCSLKKTKFKWVTKCISFKSLNWITYREDALIHLQ